MLKSITRTISAVAVAALVAFAVTILPGAGNQVSASAPITTGKGDRLDIHAVGTNCSQQAWPYYEAKCLKDVRQPMSRAKTVRVVSTDRLQPAR